MNHKNIEHRNSKYLVFLLSVLLTLNLSASDYYVKTNGIPEADGLSWSAATSFNNALSLIQSGDVIHLAAGTYTPVNNVTGGSLDEDKTFEIKHNVSIIGGYPVDPKLGDVADKDNKTILSGVIAGTKVFHVITISAPVEKDKKVQFSNLTVTGGNAGANGSGSVVINGLSYPRFNGGAMIVGKSTVVLNCCDIIENQSLYHTPGVYVFFGANVTFHHCTIANNTGVVNGGGLWNDASTVSLFNCNISNNETGGVGAGIYAFNSTYASKTYMYNTTINHNTAGHKAGYYGREKSVGVMINCTVYGNKTTRETNGGGGISLYTNNMQNNPARLDIISSTVTRNAGVLNDGGGIRLDDRYCRLNIYNSVISGNENQDIALFNQANYSVFNSVITDKVYDKAGKEISGEVFVPETMIETLADNGGYNKTCRLLGTNNPAYHHGMSSDELIGVTNTLSPPIPQTPLGEKLVSGTDLFESILSDITYEVTEGVTATEISYVSTSSLAMKLFVFEVDLTNPYISIEASTPNNSNTFMRQKMTVQATYEDQQGHKVYGGVNGDFFDLTTGVPRSILYKSGVGIKTVFQDVDRTFFAITKNKEAIVGDQYTYPDLKENIQEAVGGMYWLVKDSAIHKVYVMSYEPRTCVGISKDKKKVYFLAVDGRNDSYSNGMTFEELSKCLLALGSYSGINLDGGGSTTFFIRNTPNFTSGRFEIRNKPSDAAGERAVANGLLIISSK
ncbi:MAG: phosphodiester glycosidase family protein [Paludibacter sp.]|nr:phosphodiester glycosidase family protein [Paludibacter sp.]